MGPGDLEKALEGLKLPEDSNLLVGFDTSDDAGVYKINDDIALVQTLDFFTPIADDPYIFGQIAAANSLSDIYAMGAKPLTALNIVCFPSGTMDLSILKQIIKGGADKVQEAGASLLGGHSVNDAELKYGLSVTGIVHPNRFKTNKGGKPGDGIILTKPLGTGIFTTAIKGNIAGKEITDLVMKSMSTLNNVPSEIMMEVGANACTDVTGFGLVGHLLEMTGCSIGARIISDKVPIFPEVIELARKGILPGGAIKNRVYYKNSVISNVANFVVDVFNDPQTSGGLLIAVPPERIESILNKLETKGIEKAALIGHFTDSNPGKIEII